MDNRPQLSVLYVGLKNDYGDPHRGYSFEYLNLFDTLTRMGKFRVVLFPFDEIMRPLGRRRMNELLVKTVEEQKPDACFFVLFTDEIEKQTIRYITENCGAVTLNWFGDDHWRFESFSRHWAPLFHWVLTTDPQAVEKYRCIGCRNVIMTQWAFNHFLYKKFDLPQDFGVTFVGQAHSNRRRIVNQLLRAGIKVQCWGKGWQNGRLSQEDMIKMYSRSQINLNFVRSSPVVRWKPIAKVFLKRRADNTLIINTPLEMMANLAVLLEENRSQIKGRNFEIPGYGGFLLSEYAENLEEYYEPGKEIATFRNVDDLIDKVRYYLIHETERESIRAAGHERTLREHTFEKRFKEVFRAIGLIN